MLVGVTLVVVIPAAITGGGDTGGNTGGGDASGNTQ